jgi:hypothetical protein
MVSFCYFLFYFWEGGNICDQSLNDACSSMAPDPTFACRGSVALRMTLYILFLDCDHI